MRSFQPEKRDPPAEEPLPGETPCSEPWSDWGSSGSGDEEGADDVLDAFELDDEMADPQPEPGDFWDQWDDDEP